MFIDYLVDYSWKNKIQMERTYAKIYTPLWYGHEYFVLIYTTVTYHFIPYSLVLPVPVHGEWE